LIERRLRFLGAGRPRQHEGGEAPGRHAQGGAPRHAGAAALIVLIAHAQISRLLVRAATGRAAILLAA
jgi:hypothetical protein